MGHAITKNFYITFNCVRMQSCSMRQIWFAVLTELRKFHKLLKCAEISRYNFCKTYRKILKYSLSSENLKSVPSDFYEPSCKVVLCPEWMMSWPDRLIFSRHLKHFKAFYRKVLCI